jgi:phospholipid transport system substrate-binding protein
MLSRRSLIVAVLAVSLITPLRSSAAAAPTEDASAFIRTLGDQLMVLLRDPSLKGPALEQQLEDLIKRGTNVDLIGRLVLARAYHQATPQQIDEYNRLFSHYVFQNTAGRFEQYAGESYEITGAQPRGDKDVVVNTDIDRPGAAPMKVNWRVRMNGEPAIIDVEVEGISMVQTQRDEFAAVVQRSGIDGLLALLRQRTGASS